MTKCNKCGNENPTEAEFCIECGNSLTDGKTCEKCGFQNRETAIYCIDCGEKLKRDSPDKTLQEYIYEIARLSSEDKDAEASQLSEKAKKDYPDNGDEIDEAIGVGHNAKNLNFSFAVSCPECGVNITEYVGYCPECGHKYVKAENQYDTPDEYIYKMQYYMRNNQEDEAQKLCEEAKKAFPDDSERFDETITTSMMSNILTQSLLNRHDKNSESDNASQENDEESETIDEENTNESEEITAEAEEIDEETTEESETINEEVEEITDESETIDEETTEESEEIIDETETIDEEITDEPETVDEEPTEDSDVKICSKCGNENSPESMFCNACGNKLENEDNICPKCGNENPKESMFCNACGTNLKEEQYIFCQLCGAKNRYSNYKCENCNQVLLK